MVTPRSRSRRPRAPLALAEHEPVAAVAVAVGLAHLDRPFDYAVPAAAAADARPGVRVRVRFAGQLVDGFVLGRRSASDHPGALAPLTVVSPEVVLTPDVAASARAVAEHYAGTLADVLRLALPPRHARVEAEPAPPAPTAGGGPDGVPVGGSGGAMAALGAGQAFLRAVVAGRAPAAVATPAPGTDYAALLAEAAAATAGCGRGALLVVPDGRDAASVAAACTARGLSPVTLTADLGPAERYRRFLRVVRGHARVVVGTRAAAFAPVADLGLVAVWDDGDDAHDEPRAPHPHSREVARIRAGVAGAALLVAGWARTAETELWLDEGWAHALVPARAAVRAGAPLVRAAGEATGSDDPAARAARLSPLALRTARAALAEGPVLVQVARAGYVPGLACATCRTPARCPHCAGPLAVGSSHAVPTCRWCGRPAGRVVCAECGGRRLRATRVGAGRTAEELGRAFPGVAVRSSTAAGRLDAVPASPALVVATPGAEPACPAPGYAAALLLDGWALLAREDLRAGEETLRRWFAAAALVRPGAAGGRVVVDADPAARQAQALIRWDPAGAAARELAERTALGLPPAVALAELTGTEGAVGDLLAALLVQPSLVAEEGPHGPDGPATAAAVRVLGPVPLADRPPGLGAAGAEGPWVRTLVAVPRTHRGALTAALAATAAARSARKEGGARARLDPVALG